MAGGVRRRDMDCTNDGGARTPKVPRAPRTPATHAREPRLEQTPGNVRHEVIIEKRCIGRILGKGGRDLAALKESSGTEVFIIDKARAPRLRARGGGRASSSSITSCHPPRPSPSHQRHGTLHPLTCPCPCPCP